jgi:hypothetical protein
VRRSAGVEDPVGGAGRRIEGDCAEGVGEGLRVPQGRSRGRRLVERRVEGARGCRVEEAGRRKVGHHGLWRGRADARRPTDAAGGGVGPHVDGPGPQIEERGPLCLAGGTVVRAALVGVRAALAGVRATVFAGRAASGRWSRRARGPGARGGGGGGAGVAGLLEAATMVEAGVADGAMLSSARRRLVRTSENDGNGRWRVTSCDMNGKHLLRPRSTLSTSVRSWAGLPRSARASAMAFILRQ